jgi:hypothetical protein
LFEYALSLSWMELGHANYWRLRMTKNPITFSCYDKFFFITPLPPSLPPSLSLSLYIYIYIWLLSICRVVVSWDLSYIFINGVEVSWFQIIIFIWESSPIGKDKIKSVFQFRTFSWC